MRNWKENCCLTLTEGTVARTDWSPCLSGVLLSSVKRAEHIHLHLLQKKSYSSALTFGSGPKVDEVWASHFPLVYTGKNTFDWWEKDDRRECRGVITFVELCSSKVMYLDLGFQAFVCWDLLHDWLNVFRGFLAFLWQIRYWPFPEAGHSSHLANPVLLWSLPLVGFAIKNLQTIFKLRPRKKSRKQEYWKRQETNLAKEYIK